MDREIRRFRCASCGEEFAAEGESVKCPHCRGKALILIEGSSFRKGSCLPSGST
ncbi:MAG TPA: hypothetical protein PK188_00665 [Thermosynergistes sp.]|nr:hypothetical protein [Thermosynergistes sp.]